MPNDLLNVPSSVSSLTMTSLAIAELVESRHDKVRQSIERLAEREVIRLPPMGVVEDKQSLSPNNKTKVYNLDKRSSLIVVAQLSPEFTAALVDRWQELEGHVAVSPRLERSPEEIAKSVFENLMFIADFAKVPRSFAMQEVGWT